VELDAYSLFFGHFYRSLPLYLKQPLRLMTFLRNPIDRAISHYEHILRHEGHYFHEKAIKQGSLLNFLHDPETRTMIENYQVRSLSMILDPSVFQEVVNDSCGQRHSLERYIETYRPSHSDAVALTLAKDFLMRCAFVGVTEFMDESIRRMSGVLGLNYEKIEILNSNPMGSCLHKLSPAEWDALAEILMLDWNLYEFAVNRFYSWNSGR
jgi:hypothetical protein